MKMKPACALVLLPLASGVISAHDVAERLKSLCRARVQISGVSFVSRAHGAVERVCFDETKETAWLTNYLQMLPMLLDRSSIVRLKSALSEALNDPTAYREIHRSREALGISPDDFRAMIAEAPRSSRNSSFVPTPSSF